MRQKKQIPCHSAYIARHSYAWGKWSHRTCISSNGRRAFHVKRLTEEHVGRHQ